MSNYPRPRKYEKKIDIRHLPDPIQEHLLQNKRKVVAQVIDKGKLYQLPIEGWIDPKFKPPKIKL